MKEINANNLLMQMKILESKAQGNHINGLGINQNNQGFESMLSKAISDVNQYQMNAADMAQKFEMGDPSVSLAEVMISMQKSSISFQALTQVRNRLVSAYQDIMNMPI